MAIIVIIMIWLKELPLKCLVSFLYSIKSCSRKALEKLLGYSSEVSTCNTAFWYYCSKWLKKKLLSLWLKPLSKAEPNWQLFLQDFSNNISDPKRKQHFSNQQMLHWSGNVAKFQLNLPKLWVKVFALGRKISTMFSALKHKMAVFFPSEFPVVSVLFC